MSKTKEPTKKKQPELPAMKGPGVEPVDIPALNDAVSEYVKVRDRRMELTEQEVLKKAALTVEVERHADKLTRDENGNLFYRADDLLVTLASKKNVKVRSVHEDTESDED
jgi:hypothetical protein